MFTGLWSQAEASSIATLIIEEYTGLGGARQMVRGSQILDCDTVSSIQNAAKRVASGEPVQYIFGFTEFCGHKIRVSQGVLIPRPETEEMTLRIIKENPGFKGSITDLGTGSGCIAVSLSLAFPDASVFAIDNSDKALEIAEENALSNRANVHLIKADILTHPAELFSMSNIIVSNPPYVRESEKSLMQKNVLDYEPHEALFVPDDDPLLYYNRIAEIAAERLFDGGLIYLEINEALADENYKLFAGYQFSDIIIIEDIRGKKRILKAKKNG